MCIDREHFSQLTGDDPEFALELLTVFLEDSYERLEIMEQAITRQDLVTVRKTAHHLRGSAANVGIPAIQAIATQMEYQDHSWAELGGMALAIKQLLTQVAQFQQTIK